MAGIEKKIINFWCDRCRIDWKVIAERRVKNSQLGECWVSKCEECGRDMVRLINDAKNDPYFRLSRKVRADVKKYAKDLIQMNDPRFDILYPQFKKEREEKLAKEEEEQWKKEK